MDYINKNKKKTWIFSTGFRKTNITFHENLSSRRRDVACERTDGHPGRKTWRSYWTIFEILRTHLKTKHLLRRYSKAWLQCSSFIQLVVHDLPNARVGLKKASSKYRVQQILQHHDDSLTQLHSLNQRPCKLIAASWTSPLLQSRMSTRNNAKLSNENLQAKHKAND
jgi:hypothetical protein